MKKFKQSQWWTLIASLAGTLFLDIFAKWLAVEGVIGHQTFVRGFFYLTLPQKNYGIAFGIALPFWIQILGSLIILGILIYLGFDCISSRKQLSVIDFILFGVVVGGGLGNLIDRLLYGYVVDFIVLRPIPVFNVADIGITVGIILLFGKMILSKNK